MLGTSANQVFGGILDIKNAFYDMHPQAEAKRGIMRSGVLETISVEGSTAQSCTMHERTALEER
jgi:hypothetical protein